MKNKINQILSESLSIPLEKILPEAILKDDLNADSLDLTEIVIFLEEKFDITITPEMENNIETVQDIYDLLINNKEETWGNLLLDKIKDKKIKKLNISSISDGEIKIILTNDVELQISFSWLYSLAYIDKEFPEDNLLINT